ncbi:MAG TPA: tetratricopeptide repeat protein [Verrucomicrobiae bacterium]|nr:tetratricopeptide repeat protein [Verrucomicrobiae bacterium]
MAKLSKEQCTAAVCICIALAVGTVILYLPVIHNGFTNFDDGVYIPENSHVVSGLRWQNLLWSFTHFYAGYWIPLTWISHMIDCQLFGLNPGAHHMISVLIHAANAVLLFVLLNYMTGAMWRSAFVAALFAWHPLHVESVAWACERKDVLCAFFWMLALLCYAHYVEGKRAPSSSSSSSSSAIPQSTIRNVLYWLALLFFACGLMSKPMVVTLPFVLLLLDFWPLQRVGSRQTQDGRFNASTLLRVLIEKFPFLVLSSASCLATVHATPTFGEPLSFRLAKSLAAYLLYLVKIFAPINLAVIYPLPAHTPAVGAIAGALVLLACSLTFIFLFRRRPYLLIGWLWFLGTLVPVIGIVQAGYQSIADRFTYLPSIGLFIVITWALADIARRFRVRSILAATAFASLIACVVLTSIQIRYWRSSITLFRHTLAVTKDNFVAAACLGQALDAAGDDADALPYCQEAVRLNPDYSSAQLYLGMVLSNEGDLTNALVHLNKAVQLSPEDWHFRYNLGKFLLEHGNADTAITQFDAALHDNPDFAEAHNALGKAYLKKGDLKLAVDALSQAVALEPNNAQFHYDLGTVLLRASQTAPAIAQFTEAVRLQPDFAVAHENLAVALAAQGDITGAIEHFATVVRLQPNDSEARFNLGLAYLNNHQADLAADQFQDELRLTPAAPKAHYRLAQALREQKQWSRAVSEYRKTLALASNFTDAKKELDETLATHPQLR